MDALVQFISALVIALAAMAFGQAGIAVDDAELRKSKPRAERTIKRSPPPETPSAWARTAG